LEDFAAATIAIVIITIITTTIITITRTTIIVITTAKSKPNFKATSTNWTNGNKRDADTAVPGPAFGRLKFLSYCIVLYIVLHTILAFNN